MSWKTVKNRIMCHTCHSQTWQSEQKSLLFIVEKAKMLGLDPSDAEGSTISNLRTIASKAYQAAYNNQAEQLARFFNMAAVYKCTDLRIALGKPREEITVRASDGQVAIIVDEYQAGVIAHALRERYSFQIEEPVLWRVSTN